MAMKLYFLTLILLVANAAAWYRIERYHNPENNGKCTYNDQLILSPGETADYPNEKCAIITCMNKNGFLALQGCGVYAPPSNCKLGEAVHKDEAYPKCCERQVICNDVDTVFPS